MDPKLKEITLIDSTIETIDRAINDYINNKLNLFCETSEGSKKVEVVWVSAERAFLAKKSKEARDKEGTLNYPLITIERVGMDKSLSKKGSIFGHIDEINDEKKGTITIARRIKQNKTQNFMNAHSKRKYNQINFVTGKIDKVVYETITIPMPVYVEVKYKISIKTLYQTQMNQLMQPFLTQTGGINYFIAKYDNHRYESFIDGVVELKNNVSDMKETERIFESVINIRTLGYLIGKDINQESPKIVIRENAVELKIPREHIVTQDAPNHRGKNNRYYGMTNLPDSLKK